MEICDLRLEYGENLQKVLDIVKDNWWDQISIKIAIIWENGISQPWTLLFNGTILQMFYFALKFGYGIWEIWYGKGIGSGSIIVINYTILFSLAQPTVTCVWTTHSQN